MGGDDDDATRCAEADFENDLRGHAHSHMTRELLMDSLKMSSECSNETNLKCNA